MPLLVHLLSSKLGQSNRKTLTDKPSPLACTTWVFLPNCNEDPICEEELRAFEAGIYRAASATERGARFEALKQEIMERGLEGTSRQKAMEVLECYG